MTRDQHIAQHKKKEIEKIARQQVRLIKKAAAIPLKPSKRMDVNFRRLGKIMAIGMQIRALEMQKQTIIAQPMPRPVPSFVPGGVVQGLPAIVGDSGKEVIVTSNGNAFMTVDGMVNLPIQKD
jgi:hypothetical protein